MSTRVVRYHIPTSHDNPSLTFKDLTDAPIWVSWQQTKDGRKLPMNPTTGRAARSDRPGHLGNPQRRPEARTEAQGQPPCGRGHYVRPEIPQADGWRLCGVDLDGCFNPKTGAPTP